MTIDFIVKSLILSTIYGCGFSLFFFVYSVFYQTIGIRAPILTNFENYKPDFTRFFTNFAVIVTVFLQATYVSVAGLDATSNIMISGSICIKLAILFYNIESLFALPSLYYRGPSLTSSELRFALLSAIILGTDFVILGNSFSGITKF